MQFPIIKFKDVSVFNQNNKTSVEILKDISFELDEGDFLSIIGPSGSGKTSLLFTMTGLFEPTKGRVSFRHKKQDNSFVYLPLLKYGNYFRSKIGFSFEEPSFYPNLTVKENIIYFMNLYISNKEEVNKRSEQLMVDFGLINFKNKIASELSSGNAKILDVVCSLVNNPKILFLDEPTVNLDSYSKRMLMDKIKTLNNRGITIVTTTHDLNEVLQFSTKIMFLNKGKMIFLSTPDQLIKRSSNKHELVIETMEEDTDLFKNIIMKEISPHYITKILTSHKKIIIITPESQEIINKVLQLSSKHDISILSLNFSNISLTDIVGF